MFVFCVTLDTVSSNLRGPLTFRPHQQHPPLAKLSFVYDSSLEQHRASFLVWWGQYRCAVIERRPKSALAGAECGLSAVLRLLWPSQLDSNVNSPDNAVALEADRFRRVPVEGRWEFGSKLVRQIIEPQLN